MLLEDGRLMTFDTACMEGIPDPDAQVTVTLVPGQRGEMIGRIIVRDAWVALPDDVPYLVGVGQLLMIRDGGVVHAPPADFGRRANGETGYGIIEAKQSRERVRSLYASSLRAEELALFRAYVDQRVAILKLQIDDAERSDVESVAHELIAMIKLANRLAGHRQRRPSN